MKAQYNISSDGASLSLCGKPPTVRNTCLTTPHAADLVVPLRGKTIIWIRLENNFNWITEQWDDFNAVDRKLQTLQFPCAALKDIQTDYDLSVDKKYANTGQTWSIWVKRREVDKSLISLFAFRLSYVWKKASAHWGLRREEQAQVVWSPRGVASSKITQFKYFGRKNNTNNYPKVTSLVNPWGRCAYAHNRRS